MLKLLVCYLTVFVTSPTIIFKTLGISFVRTVKLNGDHTADGSLVRKSCDRTSEGMRSRRAVIPVGPLAWVVRDAFFRRRE